LTELQGSPILGLGLSGYESLRATDFPKPVIRWFHRPNVASSVTKGGERAFAAAARQLTSFPEAVIRPTISRPLQISDRPWRIPDFLRECNLIGQVRWELTFR
jgi:hypothetical protein